MKKIQLTEEAKNIFQEQLARFTETNIKLTDWYIHHNEGFINYIFDSLREWSCGNLKNWDIDLSKGIFLKKAFSNTPDIELSFNNQKDWAIYDSKKEKIMLFLMEDDLEILPITLNEDLIKGIIIHELTHYYDDMCLKGNGINVRNNKSYYNSFEKNAYTKLIIYLMEKNIENVVQTIVSTPSSNVETSFSTILHYSLGIVLQRNKTLNEFIQSLDEKTTKKIYKEIGEYFKSYLENHYGIFNSTTRYCHDKINYNNKMKIK